MNARKSLEGIVRSRPIRGMRSCRGRHWSNCQREPSQHMSQRLWNS